MFDDFRVEDETSDKPRQKPAPRKTMRVLVVEDEADLASTLNRALDEAHFAVDVAADGEEAQFMLGEVSYDAVVLDLMVPKRSGWMLLQDLRQVGCADAGADSDGARRESKIASRRSISARTTTSQSRLRSPSSSRGCVRSCGARRATRRPFWSSATSPSIARRDSCIARTCPIELTAREYSILELMVRHRGTLVTRSAICEHIYSESSDVFSNVIDVHIAALRRKLGPRSSRPAEGRATSSMRESLRVRLVLWYALVLTLVVVLYGGAVVLPVVAIDDRRRRSELDGYAREVGRCPAAGRRRPLRSRAARRTRHRTFSGAKARGRIT